MRTFSNLGEVREGKKFWPNNFILFSKSIISNPPLGYEICFVRPGDIILQNGHFSGQKSTFEKKALIKSFWILMPFEPHLGTNEPVKMSYSNV